MMLHLASNIDGVIRALEKRKADIPVAMERALEPSMWDTEARELAEKTLLALATPATAQWVPQFMATLQVTGLMGSNGLSLSMRQPQGRMTLAEARGARAAVSPQDLQNSLFLGKVQEFEELLEEWVRTEKDKDERDAGKTDEEIAHLLSYILLTPNPSKKVRDARKGLEPHIVDFIARKAAGGLTPETASEWLKAVLAAWRTLLVAKYPQKVRAILKSMKGDLI